MTQKAVSVHANIRRNLRNHALRTFARVVVPIASLLFLASHHHAMWKRVVSTANWTLPNSGNPSGMTSSLLSSRTPKSSSRTVLTRAPPSLHMWAAALSTSQPRFPELLS